MIQHFPDACSSIQATTSPPIAALSMQVLQLQWHLKEFFFLTAVGLITFTASALVLWSNVRASQMAALPTVLSSGYMALLIYLAVR